MSVTPLGDSSGSLSADAVGRKIAGYLEGSGFARAGRDVRRRITLGRSSSTAAYYADSSGLRPGRWLGVRSGDVDPAVLAEVITGVHQELIEGVRGAPDLARIASGPDRWTATDAADALRVDARNFRRVLSGAELVFALGTAPERKGATLGQELLFAAMGPREVARNYDGHWELSRATVQALADARRPRNTVVGYDVTFSVPKEVSVIWARGDDDVRRDVLAAVDALVAAGMRYLERHALAVRVTGGQRFAEHWTGANFLHVTSRALDPQLHQHVLVLNRAEDASGERRALDGRLLFLHARTAGHVAAAELRHELTRRLGVEHAAPVNGIARVLGVPRVVVDEMSTRRREIVEATSALGVDSRGARQTAAYGHRPEKDGAYDFDETSGWWGDRMDEHGFTADRLSDDVLGRVDGPRPLAEAELAEFERQLLRVGGITGQRATFDRRARLWSRRKST